MIKKLYDTLMLIRAKRIVNKNATMLGGNHMFDPHSRIGLMDGAKKTNVVLEDSCWYFGKALIQTDGSFIMHHHSKVGWNCSISCVDRIEIGAYSTLSNNVYLVDCNNHPLNPEFRRQMRVSDFYSEMRLWKHSQHAPIVIGENCWIGENSRICKGVTIGDNSIVAANSVVTKDIPANCIAAGNPARIVKTDIDQIPAPTSSPEFNRYLDSKQSE